jgi:hypothetical protein
VSLSDRFDGSHHKFSIKHISRSVSVFVCLYFARMSCDQEKVFLCADDSSKSLMMMQNDETLSSSLWFLMNGKRNARTPKQHLITSSEQQGKSQSSVKSTFRYLIS